MSWNEQSKTENMQVYVSGNFTNPESLIFGIYLPTKLVDQLTWTIVDISNEVIDYITEVYDKILFLMRELGSILIRRSTWYIVNQWVLAGI